MPVTVDGTIGTMHRVCEDSFRYLTYFRDLSNSILDELELEYEDTNNNYTINMHQHNFHKHATWQGHPISSEFNIQGNNGISYSSNSDGCPELWKILETEMKNKEDYDGNGQIYFWDFIFKKSDKEVPMGIRSKQNYFFMPGALRHPNKNLKGQPIVNPLNTLIIGFEMITPTAVRRIEHVRDKPVVYMTWKEYVNGIDDRLKSIL